MNSSIIILTPARGEEFDVALLRYSSVGLMSILQESAVAPVEVAVRE